MLELNRNILLNMLAVLHLVNLKKNIVNMVDNKTAWAQNPGFLKMKFLGKQKTRIKVPLITWELDCVKYQLVEHLTKYNQFLVTNLRILGVRNFAKFGKVSDMYTLVDS